MLRQMEMVMNSCVGVYFLCDVIGVSVHKKGKVSVVMELMGGDLRTFINSHHELLGYAQQVEIMQAIALGMSQLHGCGLVHKDLKASANILVLPNSWTTNEESGETCCEEESSSIQECNFLNVRMSCEQESSIVRSV